MTTVIQQRDGKIRMGQHSVLAGKCLPTTSPCNPARYSDQSECISEDYRSVSAYVGGGPLTWAYEAQRPQRYKPSHPTGYGQSCNLPVYNHAEPKLALRHTATIDQQHGLEGLCPPQSPS